MTALRIIRLTTASALAVGTMSIAGPAATAAPGTPQAPAAALAGATAPGSGVASADRAGLQCGVGLFFQPRKPTRAKLRSIVTVKCNKKVHRITSVVATRVTKGSFGKKGKLTRKNTARSTKVITMKCIRPVKTYIPRGTAFVVARPGGKPIQLPVKTIKRRGACRV